MTFFAVLEILNLTSQLPQYDIIRFEIGNRCQEKLLVLNRIPHNWSYLNLRMRKFTVSCTMNVTYGSFFFTFLLFWSHPSFSHPHTSNCANFVRVCTCRFSGFRHLIAEKKIFVHKLRLLLKIYMCTHAKAKVP